MNDRNRQWDEPETAGADRLVAPPKALVVQMDAAFLYFASEIGGKALNLARIAGCGHIPRWICVTAAAFDSVLRRIPSKDVQLLRTADRFEPTELAEAASRVRAHIHTAGFLPEEERQILDAYDQAFASGTRVAVRSSSVAEDAADHSFAGQFESYLNVQRASLLARILDCFGSTFSLHCLHYRQTKAPGAMLRTAVIIQEMVPAMTSGVLFTQSPSPSRSPEMLVAACYGLGEGVVQDQVEADSFSIAWSDGQILQRHVGTKTKTVVPSSASHEGTELVPVPDARRQLPALSDSQLQSLHAAGRRLEHAMGGPQDVEWAFDRNDRLYLLQSRPITASVPRGGLKVFDCSNISENYHGATTALTFSYLRRYYEEIFTSAATTFGMSPERVQSCRSLFANLVSYLHGGAYYNLANWYRMFYAVPGFKHFVASFEHGVGLSGTPPELERLKAESRRDGARSTTVATYARIVWVYLTLDRQFRAHKLLFEGYQKEFASVDLTTLDEDALLVCFEDIQVRLGKKWGTPLVNDYFAFNCFMALEHVVKRWRIDSSGGLLGELMRGAVEPVSVEPIKALRKVAALAAEVPALSQALQSDTSQLAAARSLPESKAFNEALASYLARFADRRPDELKLEAPTLTERPEIVWNLLRNYLRAGATRADAVALDESKNSSNSARATALDALKGRPIRRALFSLLLSATHRSLVHREYGRLVRSQRCGIERRILMEIGSRLAARGGIRAKEDIVHLSLEEIEAFVQGAGVTSSLERLIDLRRREYEANSLRPHPVRVVTHSLPQLDLGTEGFVPTLASASGSTLRGMGCSPGRVSGRARVVADPFSVSLEPGDILVAQSTDPAWAFLMASAAGLVVERGNLLSHAAIIGRELGIPCVIGVSDAMRLIPDAAMISIDGITGEVMCTDTVEKPRAESVPSSTPPQLESFNV